MHERMRHKDEKSSSSALRTSRHSYADAIALVASGRIDLKPIITGHYTLEETEQALQATRHDPANIKSVVVPK